MQVWNETFAKWLGPIPAAMHGPCCAEFVVSRERIMAHPRYSAHDLIASLYVQKESHQICKSAAKPILDRCLLTVLWTPKLGAWGFCSVYAEASCPQRW